MDGTGELAVRYIDLGGSKIFGKIAPMRDSKNNQPSEVPWGWVLASAYGSALLSVGVAEITGPAVILSVVKDYQTLIAGAATVAALFIGVQQLKRQSRRDEVDANRHYEHELEAMRALRAEALRVLRTASDPTYAFGSMGLPIKLDKPHWSRLAVQSNASVAPSLLAVLTAVDELNNLSDFGPGFAGAFSLDTRLINEARSELGDACSALLDKIEERNREIKRLIDTTS